MSPRGKEQNEEMRKNTLEKITNAALEVFSEYGYHGATMKLITRATGLSYGLVYHYFSSKEEVFSHLVDFALHHSLAAMEMVMTGEGGAWEKIEKLSAILTNAVTTSPSNRFFLIILQAMTRGKQIPGILRRIRKGFESYYNYFVPVIIKAQKENTAVKGDPTALAAAYYASVQGFSTIAFQKEGLEKNLFPGLLSNILRNPIMNYERK